MRKDRTQQLRRDLPEPPRQSQDNYAAALAEVYRALDETEMVAPHDSQRDFVDQIRERVRAEMIDAIEEVDDNPQEADDE